MNSAMVPEITKIFAHRLSWAFTLCKIVNAIVLASGPTNRKLNFSHENVLF